MSLENSKKEKLIIDGVKLEYVKKGNGKKNVILLHGFGSSMDVWKYIYPKLVEKYTVYNFNYPNYVVNPNTGRTCDLDYLSEIFELAILELKIDKAFIIGHSLGGMIAVRVKTAIPKNIEGVICVSSPLADKFKKSRWFWDISMLIIGSSLLEKAKNFMISGNFRRILVNKIGGLVITTNRKAPRHRFNSVAFLANVNIKQISECIKDVFKTDFKPYLYNNKTPILFLFGNKDLLIKFSVSDGFYNSIPNSNEISLQSSHFIPTENPNELLREITNFISKVCGA